MKAATKPNQVVYRSQKMRQDIKKGFDLTPKLGWVRKPRFSLIDIVVVLAIVKLVIYLLEHLTIHWN